LHIVFFSDKENFYQSPVVDSYLEMKRNHYMNPLYRWQR